jgi:hypothetical protein
MKILEMEEKNPIQVLNALELCSNSSICKGEEKEIGVEH